MTNIITAIAALMGATLTPPQAYPDHGVLDIIGGKGLYYRTGELDTYYDFDAPHRLLGFEQIMKRPESVEDTFVRFNKQIATFEKATGVAFTKGIYKPYSSGAFKYDYAVASNETGICYIYCHYFKDIKRGMVQWGARKPYADPKPDPFGKKYQSLWSKEFNAEIDARIEKYRKADGTFTLKGVTAGQKIDVEQIENEFQIGCNVFNFDQLGNEKHNKLYREAFMAGGIFNAATIPFYWKTFEPKRGKPRHLAGPEENPEYWKTHGKKDPFWRRPAAGNVLAFCKENHVSPHGHVIIYPCCHPTWVDGAKTMDEKLKFYTDHIREMAAYYKDTIPQWDIVNESVDRASSAAAPHDIMPWCRIPQPKDYTFHCFKAAEAFPKNVKCCINDAYTGPSDNGRYPAFTRNLLKRGCRIDVIGHQMHIFTDVDAVQVASGNTAYPNHISWKPADQIAMLKQYDEFKKPIHVSEVTFPAPVTLLPRAEAEALQARLLVDNYRFWFSWPSVYRITYWNAVDSIGGEILESGFFHRDMTKKPIYHALSNLVNKEWRTKLTATADDKGTIRFRGFKGRYRLSWKDANGTRHAELVTLTSAK